MAIFPTASRVDDLSRYWNHHDQRTNDYWILFNGVVETINPAPFANAGTFQVQVT